MASAGGAVAAAAMAEPGRAGAAGGGGRSGDARVKHQPRRWPLPAAGANTPAARGEGSLGSRSNRGARTPLSDMGLGGPEGRMGQKPLQRGTSL